MNLRKKSTPEDDAILADDSAEWGRRASAVTRVAVDQLQHLEPRIVPLLDHEFDGLRGAAITALVMHWRMSRHVPRALDMLRSDPEPDARMFAALALAHYARSTGLDHDAILRALALAVVTDAERGVGHEAYVGISWILDPHAKTSHLRKDDFDGDRDVDRALLRPYLPS